MAFSRDLIYLTATEVFSGSACVQYPHSVVSVNKHLTSSTLIWHRVRVHLPSDFDFTKCQGREKVPAAGWGYDIKMKLLWWPLKLNND